MIFKDPRSKEQYEHICPMLRLLIEQFEKKSLEFGIEPVITRIISVVPGDSSIHSNGFAVDFRDEHDGKNLYNSYQITALINHIRKMFPRSDGKSSLIYHSFNGNPWHFHGQVSWQIQTHREMVFPTYADCTHSLIENKPKGA